MKKEKLQQTPQKIQKAPKRLLHLCVNKMDNMEEIDKFLERYNLQRLNQEEIETKNRLIKSTETETMINIFKETKVQEEMISQAKSIKYLEKS